MCLCLTKADIGKKFKTRDGQTVTLAYTKGRTGYSHSHPFWLVERGCSVTDSGVEFLSKVSGSDADLVERVCEPIPSYRSFNPFTSMYWEGLTPHRYMDATPAPAGKSWESLRCPITNSGTIQSGKWSTKPDSGDAKVEVAVDFERFPRRYAALTIDGYTGFSASGLDQLGEFCTAVAKQLRGC